MFLLDACCMHLYAYAKALIIESYYLLIECEEHTELKQTLEV